MTPWKDFKASRPKFRDRISIILTRIRPYLPPINYITIHYTYFIFVGLTSSIIFWASSGSEHRIGFVDSLFFTVSGLTGAGLNTANVSNLSTSQQVIVFILMILGSPVLISFWTIVFRKHVFEKRFREIVKAERNRKMKTTGTVVGMAGAMFGLPVLSQFRSFGKAEPISKPGSSSGTKELGSTVATSPVAVCSADDSAKESTDVETEHHATLAPPAPHMTPKSPGARSVAFLEPPRSTTVSAPMSPSSNPSPRADGFNINTFLKDHRTNIGRNGQFFNLSTEEREYLGGVEYRALKALSFTLPAYLLGWQVFGGIALGSWIAVYQSEAVTVNAQNPWWAGMFLSVSAFSSTGMCLSDAGIGAFQGSYLVLIVVMFLMIAGSSAFPAFLRLIVWISSQVLRLRRNSYNLTVWKETFDFMLKYPRRVYTHLFPARSTWILVAILGAITASDWILILVLSIGNSAVESIPVGERVIDALVQAVSIFSGGLAVISPSAVYFDVQVLWLILMYVSAYPTTITMRSSNVYEERSLGIYAGDHSVHKSEDGKNDNSQPNSVLVTLPPRNRSHVPLTPMSAVSQASHLSRQSAKMIMNVGRQGTAIIQRQLQRSMTDFQGVGVSAPRHERINNFAHDARSVKSHHTSSVPPEGEVDLVSQQVRSQLSHDMWWIALALFLITLIETSHSIEDPKTYSVFNILFEIVSGYANVGMSIGLPDAAYSLSGGLHDGSKLILILVMLRGRHRGLPVALDRAVRLPGVDMNEAEEEDAEIRRSISRQVDHGA